MAAKKKRTAKPSTAVAPATDRSAILAALFDAMRLGTSVRQYAASIGVPESNLRLWASAEEYAAQYAHARGLQADAHVDEMLDVARRAASGELDPQGARLLADALKWRAVKFRPRDYSDKAELLLTGDPEQPVEVRHRWRFGDQEVEF